MVDKRYTAVERAYRDGSLVCGRIHVTFGHDDRLGLAPHERRYVAARFLDGVHPDLRAELAELARRRGAAARRAADRIEPIVVVIDDPYLGRERIVGRIEPPQVRLCVGALGDIEFGLRAPSP
ncbi:MAG TPA: hypothetical protein VG106_02365 [Vicinamibacterales bacterium]|nr:hypothetical protein [Vicinamibacterales bacterium]